jgi:hypothetical protein
VLVDRRFLKCVTFLAADVPDPDTGAIRRKPVASAFLVGVPAHEGEEGWVVYAVTARHVVDESRPYGPLYVRANRRAGGFEDLGAPQDLWVTHVSTDVAVIPISFSYREFDFMWVERESFATDAWHVKQQPPMSEGDEVFFVGLFSEYPGATTSQPIVRFGTVSLVPSEKVAVRLSSSEDASPVLVDAYLVECRSWGGQSGSPAFIQFPSDRDPNFLRVGLMPPMLLGLVSGHYDIVKKAKTVGDLPGSVSVPLNAGIAVVIPAQRVLEVLNYQELAEDRARRWELATSEAARSDLPPEPGQ